MNLTGKRPTFRQNKRHSNPYRALFWMGLLIASLFLLRSVEQNKIKPLFLPTLIPTRIAESYAMEGNAHFLAGDISKAIQSYQQAILIDTENAQLLSELARIQTYSSTLLTTDAEQHTRLQEALVSIDKAVEIAPDDSTVHAIKSFVLDWNANPILAGDQSQNILNEAEQEAVRALQLDNQNTLALAYYAEILVDQHRLLQGEAHIRQALERDDTLMDIHRIDAYVKESGGYYDDATKAYKKAVEITPNLTFLYIRIGVNYRQLKLYDLALEYFAKATTINEQLGIKDPIPYIAIGKTYTQMGEFFIAGRNTRKALQINPLNPDVYGSLGIVYFKSRNYEGAIEALKCAVYGCTAEESCKVRKGTVCSPDELDPQAVIKGIPLSGSTVVYYYTYGSSLAGMARPYNDYCEEAMKVLSEVRAEFSDEPVIIDIVQASEQICASFGYSRN